MLFRNSNRTLIFVIFMVLLIQLVRCFDCEDPDEYYEHLIDGDTEAIDECDNRARTVEPQCPEHYMEFYKDCKGALQQCSKCLQEAERDCGYQQIQDKYNGVAVNGSCWSCTTIFGRNCVPAKPMCFGYQDCGGSAGSMHCVNFECV